MSVQYINFNTRKMSSHCLKFQKKNNTCIYKTLSNQVKFLTLYT